MQEINMMKKNVTNADADVRLLMHFDGNYNDEVGAVTIGSGTLNTANKKFGTSSFTPGMVTVRARDEYFVNNIKEATIEFWVYKIGPVIWTSIISQGTYSGTYTGLDCSANDSPYAIRMLTFGPGGDRVVTPLMNLGSIPLNQWAHVAVVWKNKIATGFVNGIKQLSGPAEYWMLRPGMDFAIGNLIYANGYPYNGSFDEFRLSATALYSGNFIPPAQPFTL